MIRVLSITLHCLADDAAFFVRYLLKKTMKLLLSYRWFVRFFCEGEGVIY